MSMMTKLIGNDILNWEYSSAEFALYPIIPLVGDGVVVLIMLISVVLIKIETFGSAMMSQVHLELLQETVYSIFLALVGLSQFMILFFLSKTRRV